CRHPQGNLWWLLSPDGGTTAFVTYEGETPQVVWYNIPSGRLLKTLPGYREAIRFSPDGRYFAAVQAGLPLAPTSTLLVWEVPSGREVASLPVPVMAGHPVYPKEFSADGAFLLDSSARVWEVATGRSCFQVSGIYYGSSTFTPDGRALIC